MDRGEFQQDSVLKQLEVLKEEEKEFQNLKVRRAPGHDTPGIWSSALMTQAPDPGTDRRDSPPQRHLLSRPSTKEVRELRLSYHSSPLPRPPHQ